MKKTHWQALLAGIGVAGSAWVGSASALDLYAGASYLLADVALEQDFDPPGREDRPDSVVRTVRSDSDGSAIMAHVGMWLNESFAVEFRGAFPSDDAELPGSGQDTSEGNAEAEELYGVYILPKAEPFSWVDMVFPIGYTFSKVTAPVENDNQEVNLQTLEGDSLSYGVDLRFRVGKFFANEDSILGSLSVNTGFMMYTDDEALEVLGYNAGVQLGMRF
nr:hypothetical protein [Oceanococcus sp. HetDA_MAG_MS8]